MFRRFVIICFEELIDLGGCIAFKAIFPAPHVFNGYSIRKFWAAPRTSWMLNVTKRNEPRVNTLCTCEWENPGNGSFHELVITFWEDGHVHLLIPVPQILRKRGWLIEGSAIATKEVTGSGVTVMLVKIFYNFYSSFFVLSHPPDADELSLTDYINDGYVGGAILNINNYHYHVGAMGTGWWFALY